MNQLANFIEQVKFDDVGAVSLHNADGSVVWTAKEVDQQSWSKFKEVLEDYLRKLDANQLGAVQPTHKVIIRVSFIELYVDLFTVSDRQDDGGDDLIERLSMPFGNND